MNTTPNPLIPQGTFLEHKSKSHFRIAVYTILAVHVVLIGSFLMAGCKRTTDQAGIEPTNDVASYPPPPVTPLPAPDTSPPPVAATPGTQLVPVHTNPLPTDPVPTIAPVPDQPTFVGGIQGEHVVVKGDLLSTIAKKYGVTVRAIQESNPGVDPLRLRIGQKLTIPARTTSPTMTAGVNGSSATNGAKSYTVKSGDTLNAIARRHGTTVKDLQAANNLTTTQIKVGQKLRIPSKGGGTSAAGAPGSLQ